MGAYSCFLLDSGNVDWVLIASVYDKNGTRDSVATNEPSLHDSLQKQGARLDVGIELVLGYWGDVTFEWWQTVLQNKN